MAGVCVADGREGETMGADEGRDGRKQEEGWGGGCSVLCSSAFVLLDNNSPTPPPPDSKNQGTPSSLETGVTSKLTLWL